MSMRVLERSDKGPNDSRSARMCESPAAAPAGRRTPRGGPAEAGPAAREASCGSVGGGLVGRRGRLQVGDVDDDGGLGPARLQPLGQAALAQVVGLLLAQ